MTDKQMSFMTWLITTATDKCESVEEVHRLNEEIRKRADGVKEDSEDRAKS